MRLQDDKSDVVGNKKGRGKIAPTFLVIAVYLCQYIRGQKRKATAAIASREFIPALISNANVDLAIHCVRKESAADGVRPTPEATVPANWAVE